MKPKCKDCVHSRRGLSDVLINPSNLGWRYAKCEHPSVTRIQDEGLIDFHLGGRHGERVLMLCSSARQNRHECGPDARYHEPRRKT